MIHGILAIQGDYHAHGRAYQKLGREYLYIRKPEELDSVDTLVIPGGESTTVRKLAKSIGLWDKLKAFDKPMMGTCTGIILMANRIDNNGEESLQLLDIEIKRNAYGSQVDSFTDNGIYLPDKSDIEMTFIRAPKITDMGKGVEVISELNGEPVGVRQGNKIGLTFHPELSGYTLFHKILADL